MLVVVVVWVVVGVVVVGVLACNCQRSCCYDSYTCYHSGTAKLGFLGIAPNRVSNMNHHQGQTEKAQLGSGQGDKRLASRFYQLRTGRGKRRFKIRDLFADERCSQMVLDFLSTTEVGYRARLRKTPRARRRRGNSGSAGKGRREEAGG
jgi:hypothetical protein